MSSPTGHVQRPLYVGIVLATEDTVVSKINTVLPYLELCIFIYQRSAPFGMLRAINYQAIIYMVTIQLPIQID